ncbi:unnamed protein product, partial [Mesorhabditis spiculigera]
MKPRLVQTFLLLLAIFHLGSGEKYVRCPVSVRSFTGDNRGCTQLAGVPESFSDDRYFFYERFPGDGKDGDVYEYYGCDVGMTFCGHIQNDDRDWLPGCYPSEVAFHKAETCNCIGAAFGDKDSWPTVTMEASVHVLDLYDKHARDQKGCGGTVGWPRVSEDLPQIVMCDVTGPVYTSNTGCRMLSSRPYEAYAVAFYEMLPLASGGKMKVIYMCPKKGQMFCKQWWNNGISNIEIGCYEGVWRRWYRGKNKECTCETPGTGHGQYEGKLKHEDKVSAAIRESFPELLSPDGPVPAVGEPGRLCGAHQQFKRVPPKTTPPPTTTTTRKTTTTTTTKATTTTTKATTTMSTSETEKLPASATPPQVSTASASGEEEEDGSLVPTIIGHAVVITIEIGILCVGLWLLKSAPADDPDAVTPDNGEEATETPEADEEGRDTTTTPSPNA